MSAQTDNPETLVLLPCPFCGSADIDAHGWASEHATGPACDDCGASAGGVSAAHADNVAAWNQRSKATPDDAEAVPCHLCDGGVKKSHTGSVWCEACNRTGYRTAPPVVDARELQQAQCPNCLNDGCHCATCNPYPGELQQAQVAGEWGFLKDQNTVHAMMLRGQIAVPSWRNMVALRGEVPNGEDVQLSRIAELQEQLAQSSAPVVGEATVALLRESLEFTEFAAAALIGSHPLSNEYKAEFLELGDPLQKKLTAALGKGEKA